MTAKFYSNRESFGGLSNGFIIILIRVSFCKADRVC
jgi:hypothetical protein